MKTPRNFSLLFLSALSLVQADEGCIQPCSREYAPVCASNMRSYLNTCEFYNDQCVDPSLTIVSDGECSPVTSVLECMTLCPDDYSPLCGSDGVAYANKCVFKNAQCFDSSLTVAESSVCGIEAPTDCPSFCTMEYAPVCGSDNVTYANKCVFEMTQCYNPNLSIVQEQECESFVPVSCPDDCPRDFDPVCGTDGITYANKCLLEAATCATKGIEVAHAGACKPTVDTLPTLPLFTASSAEGSAESPVVVLISDDSPDGSAGSSGDIGNCDKPCPRIFMPLCGSDDVTYPNECVLRNAMCERRDLLLAHEGPCGESIKINKQVRDDFVDITLYEAGSQNADAGSNNGTLIVDLVNDANNSSDSSSNTPAVPECAAIKCSREYLPVCGSDGVTYSNACYLMAASCETPDLEIINEGECKQDEQAPVLCAIFCTDVYEPVCGSDGVTYANSCELVSARCQNHELVQAYEGECTSVPVGEVPVEENNECFDVCPEIYMPVCGTNSVTYGNPCEFMNAKCLDPSISLQFDGECSS